MNNLIQRLRQKMQGLQATPTRPQSPTTYVDPRLKQCTHVFLRCDRIRKPLQPPYEGPFKILNRSDKTFTILLNGKEEVVSIDHLKAVFVEKHQRIFQISPRLNSQCLSRLQATLIPFFGRLA